MIRSTSAIVRIGHKRTHEEEHIKRLALFFDHIYFVLPEFWMLTEEFLEDGSRVRIREDEELEVTGGVDPLRDASPAMKVPVEAMDARLANTLQHFISEGIASEFDIVDATSAEDLETFKRVRHQVGWQDARDPVFAELSYTSPTEYQSTYEKLRFIAYEDDLVTPSGVEFTKYAIFPPSALIDSADFTSLFYGANLANAAPVVLNRKQHAQLGYKYQQYLAGLEVLKDQAQADISPAEFRLQFGEVAFQMANAIIDSQQVARLDSYDIVQLRHEMADARSRFVSEHIITATNLVSDNPWSQELRTVLEKYIQGPLTTDLIRFQDESKARYERMFGAFAGHLVDISRGALAGGGIAIGKEATPLLANVLPGIEPWKMVLIALIGVAWRKSPELVKSVIDVVLANREDQRSSIAYVSAILAR